MSGVCRALAASLLACALLLGTAALRAAEIVPAEVDLTAVEVRMVWSSRADIERARERLQGGKPTAAGSRARPRFAKGFSALKRHAETGRYICELYVPKPEKVDDAHTLTLGHELLHCLMGSYHD